MRRRGLDQLKPTQAQEMKLEGVKSRAVQLRVFDVLASEPI